MLASPLGFLIGLVLGALGGGGSTARLGTGGIDWSVALPFTIAALGGVVAGSRVADRVDARILVRWFSASLVVLALVMISTHIRAVV